MASETDTESEHPLCYVSVNVYCLNTSQLKLLLSAYILPL